MFHFSRRTLWIIIYVTIPLIFVLNQLGGESGPEPGEAPPQRWSLDDLHFEQSGNRWLVDLPDATQARLTVVQDRAPVGVAEGAQVSQQGGLYLVTVSNPARLDLLETSIDFLVDWLPDGDQRRLVLSAPLNEDWRAALEPLNASLNGNGQAATVPDRAAVARLTAPPMHSNEQLAFLIWIAVLEQRLGGYQREVRWDHSGERSQVLFNQTLAPRLFAPVTEAELEPVLAAYRRSANQRQRQADQIHRYLVTTAVYELPLDFLLRQPERLAEVDLAAVNQQRQRTQEAR